MTTISNSPVRTRTLSFDQIARCRVLYRFILEAVRPNKAFEYANAIRNSKVESADAMARVVATVHLRDQDYEITATVTAKWIAIDAVAEYEGKNHVLHGVLHYASTDHEGSTFWVMAVPKDYDIEWRAGRPEEMIKNIATSYRYAKNHHPVLMGDDIAYTALRIPVKGPTTNRDPYLFVNKTPLRYSRVATSDIPFVSDSEKAAFMAQKTIDRLRTKVEA